MPKTAGTKRAWKMPAWMEPYRSLIGNTGGNSVEDMVNMLLNDGKNLSYSNIVLYTMASDVQGQVSLLARLHEKGLLGSAK